MKSKHTIDLTSGSVVKKLLIFAFPILISNIMQQLYNTADMIVVGKFAGDNALAAVGATGEITTLILNLFFGLSISANIVCSNLFGAKNKEGLSRCMHTTMPVALICGLLLSLLGLTLSRPALQLTSCPNTVIDDATLYMQIYFCGAPASMLYNFGAAILRAHGDTKRPMIILMISGIVNVVLNLVLVIVFHMGVAGVSIATITSQVISAIVVVYILFSPKEAYQMQLKKLKICKQELLKLIRIGMPCGLNGIVFNFANIILQSSVNALGEIAMAGVTASTRITNVVYMILSSTYSGCVSFSGQCFGAKNYKRIDELWKKSILLCGGIVAAVALPLTLFSDVALGLFTNNPVVIKTATPMLLIFLWSYVLYAIPECTVGCIRGMGASTIPTLMNIVCICAPRVIWNYFFFPLNPTIGWLYICYPISYVICSIAQVIYYLYRRRKLHRLENIAHK